MSSPSWEQLARIPESLEKRSILHALEIDPPPEGVSNMFSLPSGHLQAAEGGLLLVVEAGASFYIAPWEAHSVLRLKRSTPTGELLSWWLQAKGYTT